MKLCFPSEILSQHLVVLGKTGAGKSSVLRHIVEHLLDHKKRVCIVDPKGDWWGLKSSRDGQDAGYPVIAFGDFKEERAADIPINDRGGKPLAELVATGNRPCIIGFRGWMPSAMTRFWIDFSSTLFNANAGELYLVIDEVHNFAAKGKIMDPEAGKCLHWTNRLMSEGRGVGLVSLIASQRPQKVHNDTLTCCETLVAMRVIHKSDRQAVKDWIDGCGDGSSGSDVLNNLAQLDRGDAYVWSPENSFGPKHLKFPMFETFDSFAPPQLQKKVSERGWGATDLETVRSKLAAVIKEAESNDPKILRGEIQRLRGELAKKPESAAPERIEVPVFSDGEIKKLEGIDLALTVIGGGVASAQDSLEDLLKPIAERLAKMAKPVTLVKPSVTPPRSRTVHVPNRPTAESLDPGQQKILDTIAMLKIRGVIATRDSVARWHRVSNRNGLHPTGGTYGQNLAVLRSSGYLSGCELTDAGQSVANGIESGFEAACATVDGGQERILRVLFESQDKRFTRDTLAAALDLHPTGGTYGQNLARLRTMGLLPERGDIYLTDAAFR